MAGNDGLVSGSSSSGTGGLVRPFECETGAPESRGAAAGPVAVRSQGAGCLPAGVRWPGAVPTQGAGRPRTLGRRGARR